MRLARSSSFRMGASRAVFPSASSRRAPGTGRMTRRWPARYSRSFANTVGLNLLPLRPVSSTNMSAHGATAIPCALVQRVRAGASWQESASHLFGEQGSYGNGCVSRVPPVGAFFADDFTTLIAHARRSAWVTHQHPEAIAGTIAVANATAWAWQLGNFAPMVPGDCDTTCAIVGGVVAMRTGAHRIPHAWSAACEPLAEWAFQEALNV